MRKLIVTGGAALCLALLLTGCTTNQSATTNSPLPKQATVMSEQAATRIFTEQISRDPALRAISTSQLIVVGKSICADIQSKKTPKDIIDGVQNSQKIQHVEAASLYVISRATLCKIG